MALRLEDYAMIGDTHTGALVGNDGSIDWLCLPRFDSGAVFGALLGNESNGRWQLAPLGGVRRVQRRYRAGTLVLDTELETDTGAVRITDFMPHRDGHAGVVRIVEGVAGHVSMGMRLVMRFDYGRTVPWVRRLDGRLIAVAGPDALVLDTPVATNGEDHATVARFTVSAGEQVPFVLSWLPSTGKLPDPAEARRLLEATEAWWQAWSARCTYRGEWRDAVSRSCATLKALTYGPTGGIVAALTTSVPERLGGVRNWDYRYVWLRDATLTLHALLATGYVDEAQAWRDWLVRAVAGDPAQLQIMYGVEGERRLPEIELDWLSGYEGSRPVRVGNAAVDQLQLDVYGEVMDVLHLACLSGCDLDSHAWEIQRAFLDFLESAWQAPDEGIWEVRGPRRHFAHSKVMAWVAFDRAVKAVEGLGRPGPSSRWRRLRDAIHDEVCREAFDPERGTFTQSYGSRALDASLLLLPLVGFLPPQDPRVVGTVEAIERELCEDGLVLRYNSDERGDVDGLPAGEGAFLACSFWLADVQCALGRTRDARALFERLLGLANDVGLLSEEYDVEHRHLVGNFPQAFSHVALIDTARRLSATAPGRATSTPRGSSR
ncbi:MAG: glycoside hydrolase family 15 protein [Actinomycetota bacterium]|nr:glycoside hydrolase family 15 protein [Actinomycetota bacterium]